MRRAWLVLVPLLLAAAAWWGFSSGAGAADDPPLSARPALGVADTATVLMGAAGDEIWAYRRLPRETGLPAGVELGPAAGTAQQLAFLRWTDATGWQVAETPQDAAGATYRGPDPNRSSARITPGGGGLLVGRGSAGVTVLARRPGGHFREAPPVPAGSCARRTRPRRRLRPRRLTRPPRPRRLLRLARPRRPTRPLRRRHRHADGHRPTRRRRPPRLTPPSLRRPPLRPPRPRTAPRRSPTTPAPAASPTPPTRTAASCTRCSACSAGAPRTRSCTTTTGRASGRASRSNSPARSSTASTSSRSTPRAPTRGCSASTVPGRSRSSSARTPAGSRARSRCPAGLTPLPAGSHPLTVTADGLWIDAALRGATDATFFRAADGTLTSWCDAGCDHGFNARFSRGQGYRSIGFAGGGRVISNPLPPGGTDEDNRGAYLVRRGDDFVRMPGGGGSYRPSAAFSSPDDGWLEGPVQVSAEPAPDRLQPWPVAVRAPLTAAVSAPGQAAGSVDSAALAVGQEGGVLRYAPGRRLDARVPAGLERRGVQAAAARRRLAGAGPRARRRRPRRDVDVARRDRSLGTRSRGADRLRGQPDGDRLPARRSAARLRGRQGGRVAALRQDVDAGAAARGLRRRRTSRASPSPAPRRWSPRAATCSSTTAPAGTPTRASARCSRRCRAPTPRFVAVAGLPDGGAVAAGAGFVIERDGPDDAVALLDPAAARRHAGRARRVPLGRSGSRARRRPAAAARTRCRTCCRRPGRTRRRRSSRRSRSPATATSCARPTAAGATSSAPRSPARPPTGP